MDRIEKSDNKYRELFGELQSSGSAADPEFQNILRRFIFADVFSNGGLTDQLRELITLVVLSAGQSMDSLRAHVAAALNIGVAPAEIREALYQCAPYIGFPKTQEALNCACRAFEQAGIPVPLEPGGTVTEETRFEEGLKVQKSIFGDVIDRMRDSAAEDLKPVQDYLSAYCFGDIYTRDGLDLKTRELLTLCILVSLGGCESQVKSHLFGNARVGNSRGTVIAALIQCLPYVGFPRTLNALSCLDEIVPEKETS